MTREEYAAAVARCDQEIDEISTRPDVLAGQCPAWLVTLGIEDWEREKRLLAAQYEATTHG